MYSSLFISAIPLSSSQTARPCTASMASSSSSHQSNEEPSSLFDVFISHRGPHAKRTLAIQLCNDLQEVGIRAFLDSEERELGVSFLSTVETTITSAFVLMPIFSTEYAESPRCLNELVLMSQNRANIIPLFDSVRPLDLRYLERGPYADAFSKYENTGTFPEKLKEWKEALRSVSFLKGYEFNNSEGCKRIVPEVQKEIQRRKYLYVAKYPVGLHKVLQDFERRCLVELGRDFERQRRMSKESEGKAQIVGIFGLGGVGKTTLSKELFNKKRSQYTRACFVGDVREESARGRLLYVQLKLLKDLFGEVHRSFPSLKKSTEYLRYRLARSSSLNFLIVLDDVDQVKQLADLCVFDIVKKCTNTLVIVTTRDKGVLISAGTVLRYNLKMMSRDDGRELFCWHAFRQPHPRSGYEKLVDDFVDVCGGLPLSLQVLGKQVSNRAHGYWQLEFSKVKASRTLPWDIKQRLGISFDALDEEEKQVFMDIACFFVDKSKSIAQRVWEGSGWNAQHALQTLKNKCLVEEIENVSLNMLQWQDGPVLRMHDHLRDLGREMASDRSPPRRLCRPHDLEYLELMGFENILTQTNVRCFHSIFDNSTGSCVKYFFQSDTRMKTSASLLWLQLEVGSGLQPRIPSWVPLESVQCLKISFGQLKTLCENPLQPPLQLRELRITQCRSVQRIPNSIWLSLKNMRILELFEAWNLKEIWEDNVDPPLALTELRITECSNVQRLPISIGRLRHLTKIILNFGFRGSFLPEEFCDLQSLEHLELLRCPMLSSLPVHFGDLKNLRHVDLSGCGLLEELPVSFQQLIYLQFLKLSCCWKLKLRLDLLKNITSLKYLDLTKCHEVKELPHQITNQASLKRLFVNGTSLRDVPTNFGERCKLEELRIGNPLLPSLPFSLGNLYRLNSLLIDGCPQLEYLPTSVCLLHLLKEVRICASGLRELPFGAGSSESEVTDKQPSNSSSNLMASITEHGSLQTYFPSKLPASSNRSVSKECCPMLETLSLVANPQLKEIRTLPQSLKILEICGCKTLKNISGIGGMAKLRRLEICSCPELEELPSLAGLVSLQEFKMQGCPKVEKVQGLEHCTSLQVLTADVPLIESFENVEGLRKVQLICGTEKKRRRIMEKVEVAV